MPEHALVVEAGEGRLAAGVLGGEDLADRARVALEREHLELVVGEPALEDLAQGVAAVLGEERLAQLAVAHLDDLPAVREGGLLDALGVGVLEALLVRDARPVEVLAVVVDDPGDVAEQALGDVEASPRGASPRGTRESPISDQKSAPSTSQPWSFA